MSKQQTKVFLIQRQKVDSTSSSPSGMRTYYIVTKLINAIEPAIGEELDANHVKHLMEHAIVTITDPKT